MNRNPYTPAVETVFDVAFTLHDGEEITLAHIDASLSTGMGLMGSTLIGELVLWAFRRGRKGMGVGIPDTDALAHMIENVYRSVSAEETSSHMILLDYQSNGIYGGLALRWKGTPHQGHWEISTHT